MLSTSQLSSQLLTIGTIEDPAARMKSLVAFANKHFAWGLDPLHALIGPECENGRFCGRELAKKGGGVQPEFLELIEAAINLKAIKDPKSEEATELKTTMKKEFADVLMMVFALANQLGINTDESLHEGCKKMIQRFDNILEFVRQGKVTLSDLKKPKLFQELWVQVKQYGVYAAQLYNVKNKRVQTKT